MPPDVIEYEYEREIEHEIELLEHQLIFKINNILIKYSMALWWLQNQLDEVSDALK
jgi:hypothetical protein